MKHDKNDLFIKFNYKTYLITHCLKIHLLVMGFIEKPTDTILLYKYRNFLSVRKDNSIRNMFPGFLLPIYYADLLGSLMLRRGSQMEEIFVPTKVIIKKIWQIVLIYF